MKAGHATQLYFQKLKKEIMQSEKSKHKLLMVGMM